MKGGTRRRGLPRHQSEGTDRPERMGIEPTIITFTVSRNFVPLRHDALNLYYCCFI